MSTFFFKATELKTDSTRIQECLDSLKREGAIEKWEIDPHSGDPIVAVDTLKISSEELKHRIREGGIDADFSEPPQRRTKDRPQGRP
ncbi:hypothetical protein [Flavisolibacter tropicus]|uniref:HMA domain-containing protein n=1 Tax=Flavisolibacter tropicus TaxID=1492898 RepID=A0A172U097_9BACT|nr:hypothetical protein [Flavisolibacter tropicus]ANE52775.1 hypothetical protein SY85_22145 [Flavisolibacter tropicus]